MAPCGRSFNNFSAIDMSQEQAVEAELVNGSSDDDDDDDAEADDSESTTLASSSSTARPPSWVWQHFRSDSAQKTKPCSIFGVCLLESLSHDLTH
jgi:hypothetical protein